jgi:5'(3')-deoxyribonucleotidase
MYHFQKTACYMLNSQKGYNLKYEDWSGWNWPKTVVTNNDWQWLWTAGVRAGLFRYGHLYRGTIEAVRNLSNFADIVVITSRPRDAVQDTLDWIAYLNLPIREIHILSDKQLKSSVPHCDLYVDDKPENIDDYQENTEGLALLWTRPWNVKVEGWKTFDDPYIRVDSWKEVVYNATRLHDQGQR